MANKIINILMADDDEDDRFFFARALKESLIASRLTTVKDGEELMEHLAKGPESIPDLLFLDINMPRKNGLECLREIKASKAIVEFPVIIYSTSLTGSGADVFFEAGAHYYIRKAGFSDLTRHLAIVLTRFASGEFKKATRDNFVLDIQQA